MKLSYTKNNSIAYLLGFALSRNVHKLHGNDGPLVCVEGQLHIRTHISPESLLKGNPVLSKPLLECKIIFKELCKEDLQLIILLVTELTKIKIECEASWQSFSKTLKKIILPLVTL